MYHDEEWIVYVHGVPYVFVQIPRTNELLRKGVRHKANRTTQRRNRQSDLDLLRGLFLNINIILNKTHHQFNYNVICNLMRRYSSLYMPFLKMIWRHIRFSKLYLSIDNWILAFCDILSLFFLIFFFILIRIIFILAF